MAFGAGEPGAKVIPSQFKRANESDEQRSDKSRISQLEYETSCSAAAFLYFPFLHDCMCVRVCSSV